MAMSSLLTLTVHLNSFKNLRFHNLNKKKCIIYFQTCSNPSFSKTILFRPCDGLNSDTLVKIIVYDVKEKVSETMVPMGYTSVPLSTIQVRLKAFLNMLFL